MKLVGERGNDSGIFLILSDEKEGKGFIYNMSLNKSNLPRIIDSYIKFGYWSQTNLKEQTKEVKDKLLKEFPDLE